jgi:Domain of unknown function (DUF1902)
MSKPKIIRIRVDQGKAGLFYAQSPDLRGLLVAAENTEELKAKIPGAIADLLRAMGTEVEVREAEDGDPTERPWVAIPKELVAARSMGAIGSDD